MVNKFTLFVFVCLMVAYSNLFIYLGYYLGYTFEYQQVIDIQIVVPKYNFTNNSGVIIGKLKNGNFCQIDVKNKVMIEKIINDMKLENSNKYYTTIIKSNNVCSIPVEMIEIIIDYVLFCYSVVISSIISMMIIVGLKFEYDLINEDPNPNHPNHSNQINYHNFTNLYRV